MSFIIETIAFLIKISVNLAQQYSNLTIFILFLRFFLIMPKPLSNDLRKRIIDAKLRGDTEDKIASEKEVL